MHKILSKHSLLYGSSTKELNYFNSKVFENSKAEDYHKYFPLKLAIPSGSLSFESSPAYLFNKDAPGRIFNYNPKSKLIVTLREPAERALSAWIMYHHHFKNQPKQSWINDKRPFAEAIREEMNFLDQDLDPKFHLGYVSRGLYFVQLQRYLNYFNQDQILVIESSSLRSNHDETMRAIQSFLGVPYEKLEPEKINSSRVKKSNDEYNETLAELREFFKPHNEQLFDLLGVRYDW